jgi:hypothetical protein
MSQHMHLQILWFPVIHWFARYARRSLHLDLLSANSEYEVVTLGTTKNGCPIPFLQTTSTNDSTHVSYFEYIPQACPYPYIPYVISSAHISAMIIFAYSQYGTESQYMGVSFPQKQHIMNVLALTREVPIPTLILCLGQHEFGISIGDILGYWVVESHTEFVYHMQTDVNSIKASLSAFLEKI